MQLVWLELATLSQSAKLWSMDLSKSVRNKAYVGLAISTLDCDPWQLPFAPASTTQYRAFSVVGPSIWNGLPLGLCLPPSTDSSASLLICKNCSYQLWVGWKSL